MVMGQFVTTYRKDFLWPYVSTLGVKPIDFRSAGDAQLQPCRCHMLNKVPPTNEQTMGPEAMFEDEWNKLGPTGPLLEPQTVTARVSPAPVSDVSKYNQPNAFMTKLQEKYPFIYECLKTAPPDDLIARVNKDRLSSTYQVDFCNMREFPADPYEELMKAAGVGGIVPCQEPIKLPGDPCRQGPKSKISAKRNGEFTKTQSIGQEVAVRPRDIMVGSCKGGVFTVTPGATEYQDTYSRLGTLIIRDGIHDAHRRKILAALGPEFV